MNTIVKRSYTTLLRPTARQERLFVALFQHHTDLYNAGLQERTDAYRCRYGRKHLGGSAKTCPCGKGREPVRCMTTPKDIERRAQLAQLTDLRATDPYVAGFSNSAQQRTLQKLDRTFQAFFARVQRGDTPGFPRYQSVRRWDSVEWTPKSGATVLTPTQPSKKKTERGKERHLRISDTVNGETIGCVRMKTRGITGYNPDRDVIKSIRIKREGGHWDDKKQRMVGVKWYVILACEVPARPRPQRNTNVGIDLGINELAATSDGTLIPNPKHLQQSADKIADLQRQRATKQGSKRGERRSRRHRELTRRIAAEHRNLTNKRKNTAWGVANYLVRRYDLIAHEDLQISNMIRTPKPKPDPEGDGYLPNGAAAKTGLNRSIADAGWGNILHALHVKAESAGRTVVVVDPRNTSRTCPVCGQADKHSRRGPRFSCVHCGHTDHADTNAAINILGRAVPGGDAHVTANAPPHRGAAGGSPPVPTTA